MSRKNAFIDAILSGLSGNREALHEPDGEIELGEEVLGVLESQKARAVYSLMVELNKANHAVCTKLKDVIGPDGSLSREAVNVLEPEIHRARNQSSIIGSLFWELVHEEFPKSRMATVAVGIREGWRVVIFKNNQPSMFDQMRSRILLSSLFNSSEE